MNNLKEFVLKGVVRKEDGAGRDGKDRQGGRKEERGRMNGRVDYLKRYCSWVVALGNYGEE